MRIAHVVAYVSADGAFGGPVAVLRAQTTALAAADHEVVVFAGWDGRAFLQIPGVQVRLFRAHQLVPGTGFSGLVAHGLTAALLAGGPWDAVHVHLGRHLVGLEAALAVVRRGGRLVVQSHGMLPADTDPKTRLTDRLLTRRVLRGASAVLALTAAEEPVLTAVAGAPLPLVRVPNGIAVSPAADRAGPAGRNVLFLARLHPRKRVLAYVEAAAIVRDAGDPARFAVVGPDEGDLTALAALIGERSLGEVVTYEGALPPGAGAARIAAADVYVLPAEREVFPMTVLEAMSVGTPVVLARDCAIAGELADAGAAVVVDGSPQSIATAVRGLLDDPAHWRDVSSTAREVVRTRLSIEAVAGTLLAVYAGATRLADGAGQVVR